MSEKQENARKSKQNCLSILNPSTEGSPLVDVIKSTGNCNVNFTFDQLANLITTLTSDFTNSIKTLVDKFENINCNKNENLELQIQDLNVKCDSLQTQIHSISKQNDYLRNLLCDSYINKIKEKEEAVANDFVISGFTELIALDVDSNVKSPEEIMNAFSQHTLKLPQPIVINNASVHIIPSKLGNATPKIYKLKASLTNASDWGLIFSKIRNLKDTELYFDRTHSNEVQKVLTEFRTTISKERALGKSATLKNLTLTLDDNTFEVFSILKSRFLKSV
jgi:hypothetical protein